MRLHRDSHWDPLCPIDVCEKRWSWARTEGGDHIEYGGRDTPGDLRWYVLEPCGHRVQLPMAALTPRPPS